jgi:hypothetical protein
MSIPGRRASAMTAWYASSSTDVPFVSYPYEWSFAQLRAAAMHQLDVHLHRLSSHVILSARCGRAPACAAGTNDTRVSGSIHYCPNVAS